MKHTVITLVQVMFKVVYKAGMQRHLPLILLSAVRVQEQPFTMEDPRTGLVQVMKNLLSAQHPGRKKDIIEHFFVPNAGYCHPLFVVSRAAGSRRSVSNIYECDSYLNHPFLLLNCHIVMNA